MRVRLGRALALDPAILLLEHVSAALDRGDVAAFGGELRAIAARRGAALVAATADETFARAVAARVLTLEPATGRSASSGAGDGSALARRSPPSRASMRCRPWPAEARVSARRDAGPGPPSPCACTVRSG